MTNTVAIEKFADSLARFAVTGDNTAFVKLAQEHGLVKKAKGEAQAAMDYISKIDPRILYSLTGAGAGGLIGLLQGKNKGRNALWYGLTGGLTGLGLGMFSRSANQAGLGASGAGGEGGENNDGLSSAARDAIKTITEGAGLNPQKTTSQYVTGGAAGLAAGLGTRRALNSLAGSQIETGLNPSQTTRSRIPGGAPRDLWSAPEQRALGDLQSLRQRILAGQAPPPGVSRSAVDILRRGRVSRSAANELSRLINSSALDPDPSGTAAARAAAIAAGNQPPSYRGTHIPPNKLYAAALRHGGRTGIIGRGARGTLPILAGLLTGSIAAENAPKSYSETFGRMARRDAATRPQQFPPTGP